MRRGGSEHDIKISDLLKKQLNKKKISAIMSGFLIAQLFFSSGTETAVAKL